MCQLRKMKFPLRWVFLCSAACLVSQGVCSGNDFAIAQTPDLEVTEHGAVQIMCCWDSRFSHWKVNWYKDTVEILNMTIKLWTATDSGACLAYSRRETCNCTALNLSNVTARDSGRYICRVTINRPTYLQSSGNGSSLRVTRRTSNGSSIRRRNSSHPLLLPLAVPLAAVAVVLLIALASFWILRRTGSDRAARVIYEVPHSSSEEAVMVEAGKKPGEDGHSTSSSRGSTQWCQVPVYESFSYFEAMENKSSD